jgi:rSAM/selenodomain-associated transferase 2
VSAAPVLSVIIPALEEAHGIAACIDALRPLRDAGAEILVIDAGSRDATAALAAAAGVRVLQAARGRAAQMNTGTDIARGGMLAFLHADTRPTPDACRRLLDLAGRPGERWGRFDVRLSGPGAAFRVIESCMNLRSRLTGIATGDQLMFASRSLFQRAGGFPDVPLMEDVALSGRLKRLASPCCCRERVHTSSRRWRQHGVLRTVLHMWRLRAAFWLGADPARLAQHYDA